MLCLSICAKTSYCWNAVLFLSICAKTFCHWPQSWTVTAVPTLLGTGQSFLLSWIFLVFSDRMKESMVAKLAYQCSELYADAMKLMQLGSIRDLWPRVSLVYCLWSVVWLPHSLRRSCTVCIWQRGGVVKGDDLHLCVWSSVWACQKL